MTIVVETGSGSSTSNSYGSVSDATTYFTDRGRADAWDAIDDKEAALIQATDYMVYRYRLLWAGYRVLATQALDWPRYEVPKNDTQLGGYYLSTDIPQEIKRACFELAMRTADGPLMVDLERAVQTETIGPLSTTYFSADAQQKRFSEVDAILRPLFSGRGFALKVSRA